MSIVHSYLNWLCREQANSICNVLIKTGNVIGNTVTVADAIAYIIEQVNYDAIWASVHSVIPSAVGKTKLVKSDIEAYRYLAIDIDSRASHKLKQCATDDERAKTEAVAVKMTALLQGYGLPTPLRVMSGNGSLLLFPINLPNNEANYNLLERFAKTLGSIYDDEHCDVDEAVIKDPSRVLGVVGTFNNKAENVSAGRVAKLRCVLGEYPPNKPMGADAFIEAVNRVMADHNSLASSILDGATGATADDAGKRCVPGGSSIATDARSVPTDAVERAKRYLTKMPDAVEGQGGSNATLRAACECFRFGLSDSDASHLLNWFNDNKCKPSWTSLELAHKLKDARDKVIGKGDFGIRIRLNTGAEPLNEPMVVGGSVVDYPTTDVGNTDHFIAVYGSDIKYVKAWKTWIRWNGKHWEKDACSKVERMAIRFVRHVIPKYATTIKDDERRTRYLKFASQCQSENRIQAIVNLSADELAIEPKDLDFNGNLFNLAKRLFQNLIPPACNRLKQMTDAARS